MSKVLIENDDISVEIQLARLADELGIQYILGDRENSDDMGYLAALSLETMEDDGYDTQDTLMEFIRTSGEFDHLDSDDCREIENLLR